MDVILCNSPVVKARVEKYWEREAKIVYPPIETAKYSNREAEDFFLYISRLLQEKRADIVIKAFEKCHYKLVVVGKGMTKCEEMAKGVRNIDYKGNVSETAKIDLLSRCKAVIYPPLEEDFGLVPIEAFASGRPVIGVKEGFTKYQINKDNRVFAEPTPEAILKAVEEINSREWNSKYIASCAKRYDISIFIEVLKKAVRDVKLSVRP